MFTFIDDYGLTIFFSLIFSLMLIGISPINEAKFENTGDILLIKLRKFIMGLVVIYSLVVLSFLSFILKKENIQLTMYLSHKIGLKWSYLIIGFLIVLFVKIAYLRWVKVWFSDVKKSLVNQVKTDEVSDIKTAISKYRTINFDPEDYIDLSKGLFFGLDAETKKPLYIDIETYKKTHKELIGPTRSGKGVTAAVLDYQKILLGWGLIYIDPKPDEFIPMILDKACEKANKKLVIIDLVESPKPVYAPFRGGRINDIKSRLKQVLKLRRTGGAEDFYKGQEINMIDDAMEETNRGIPQIYKYLQDNRPKGPKGPSDVPTGIEDMFKALNRISTIKPNNGSVPHKSVPKEILYPSQSKHRHVGGVSIARAIMENQVVYVRGDTTDLDIRAITRLLLTEVIQEVKRLYPYRDGHFSINVDEGKFMMGEIVSDAQAVIAGFGCDMTMQYQSLEDIETSIEKDIDMKALAQALHVNSQIKIIHGGLSARTAEYVKDLSGTVHKRVAAMDKASVGKMGAETWDDQKMIKNQREDFFTSDDFLAMPERTYALLQKNNLTTVVNSCFINVEGRRSYHEMLFDNT